jgi:general secretion pathway protein G
MKRRSNRRRRAFTLIELLIVIAILLAIGGLVVVNLLPAKDQADIDLTRVQIDQIENALKYFKVDLKRWPSEEEGITVLWSKDALEDEEDEPRWKGPYLENATPKDTWDQEWVYRAPSEIRDGAPYDIVSLGPDGEEDTDDDVHNHLRMMDEEGEIDEAFDDFTSPDADDGG